MTLTNRVPILLFLPLLFFGAGILSAGLAITAAKSIAPEPITLLDAVAMGNDEAIFRMISEGYDPGLPRSESLIHRMIKRCVSWPATATPMLPAS